MATGNLNPLVLYFAPLSAPPSIYDVVTIQGQVCPGTVTLSGFKRKWNWDKKQGKGSQGTTPTQVGKPAVTGDLTFWLWSGDHFAAWETFRPLFLYDATRASVQAVSVFHPALSDLGINSLVCESLSPILHVGNNLYSCVAEMAEFIPPPKAAAVSTPTTSKTGQGAGTGAQTPPAPTDPQQVKIAQLYAQLVAP